MRLAALNTQVRQRTPWEAIDLGFALVRHNWSRIYVPWTLLLVLLATCLWLLVPGKYSWAAGLTLWWLKPLYDRILLSGFSQGLFGQYPTTAETFSALPGLCRHNGLFSALTWRRFSLSRSYNLPIWQLEGLRGQERKQRQNLLYLQGHAQAIALTLTCVALELVLTLSLYGLVLLLDPSGTMNEHAINLLSGKLDAESESWQNLVDFVFVVVVTIILEPYFVAAGFALYLNRRTQLEAWDLEIALRSLGERLQALAKPVLSGFLLVCLLGISFTGTSQTACAAATEYLAPARQPIGQLQHELTEVMQSEELANRQKVTLWVPKNKDEKKPEQPRSKAVIELVSFVLKSLLWVAALITVVLLIIYRRQIIDLLRPIKKARHQTAEQPDVLFGLDIRPESLPADIAGAARQHWESGHPREALSLLYRGALMLLTREQELLILDSHTEGDVLQLSRQKLSGLHLDYLRTLTRHWQYIAYAHRQPAPADMEHLLVQWPEFQSMPGDRVPT